MRSQRRIIAGLISTRRAATSVRKMPIEASTMRSQKNRALRGIVVRSRDQRSAPAGVSGMTRPPVSRAMRVSKGRSGEVRRTSSPDRLMIAVRSVRASD